MSVSYLPLSLRTLKLGQAVPVDLWNEQGVLLFARGQVIQTDTLLRSLAAHRPMVREDDYHEWARSTPEGHALIRSSVLISPTTLRHHNGPANDAIDMLSLTVPAPGSHLDPIDLSLRLSKTLAAILRSGDTRIDFLERLNAIDTVLSMLLEQHTDDLLFMLIQMMQDSNQIYSANHALMSDIICRLAYPHVAADMDVELSSLTRAALTMNIGMFALHNELRVQKTPVDPKQRAEIHQHPEKGVELLSRSGASDTDWLRLVLEHHETPEGDGYPTGKPVHTFSNKLLHLADLFAAAVTPRSNRKALAPLLAMRKVYSQGSKDTKALGELLVRCLGLYPPGSYVRLANQEMAVVVRRGSNAKQPYVVSITNSQGIALAIPVLRDTQHPEFAVVAPVPPDAVKVRLDPARVLKRI
jgi:hypothetical protein